MCHGDAGDGECRRGHGPLRLIGGTYVFNDYRDNIIVDPDAPVLRWRQEKGHRLGYENSREALTWNVFRSLKTLGALGAVLAPLGIRDECALYFWGREDDGRPWAPFAEARDALEEHVRGPDRSGAEPGLIAVCPMAQRVLFVDGELASRLRASRPPAWFAAPPNAAARRRRRAIVTQLEAEEPHPGLFRRGLGDAIRRGFHGLARRLLLARAVARRLGPETTSALVEIVNPATMPQAFDDAARFAACLAPKVRPSFQIVTWASLWERVPASVATRRGSPAEGHGEPYLRRSLADYLGSRTVRRAPADLIPA